MPSPVPYQADFDLGQLGDTPTPREVIKAINDIAFYLNFFNKSLSLQANFNGYIAENITIPATSEAKIQHFLGVQPKWRIILRQVGNGVITDIPSNWNDKVISLYNNGAVEVTLTVFIARE